MCVCVCVCVCTGTSGSFFALYIRVSLYECMVYKCAFEEFYMLIVRLVRPGEKFRPRFYKHSKALSCRVLAAARERERERELYSRNKRRFSQVFKRVGNFVFVCTIGRLLLIRTGTSGEEFLHSYFYSFPCALFPTPL